MTKGRVSTAVRAFGWVVGITAWLIAFTTLGDALASWLAPLSHTTPLARSLADIAAFVVVFGATALVGRWANRRLRVSRAAWIGLTIVALACVAEQTWAGVGLLVITAASAGVSRTAETAATPWTLLFAILRDQVAPIAAAVVSYLVWRAQTPADERRPVRRWVVVLVASLFVIATAGGSLWVARSAWAVFMPVSSDSTLRSGQTVSLAPGRGTLTVPVDWQGVSYAFEQPPAWMMLDEPIRWQRIVSARPRKTTPNGPDAVIVSIGRDQDEWKARLRRAERSTDTTEVAVPSLPAGTRSFVTEERATDGVYSERIVTVFVPDSAAPLMILASGRDTRAPFGETDVARYLREAGLDLCI